ncbi:hypothetical protein KUTeg_004922 [Tegillarca granosa]|uniref:Exocyst complex component Sec8 n=1 Tax=Tegillarca granosa TaxID=220873 RepID=A0ABQ9FIA1_TEGGR|nr:hypothetical protein KUTeg_004922 [Tegillarca granosa]
MIMCTGFDALRHVIDHKTQRDLSVTRPLLMSTVTVDRNINELRELMHDLPDYADQFLNMICNILKTTEIHVIQLIEELPPVSDKTLESLHSLVKDFLDLSEICLLLIYLEIRVHCFYYLLPVAKQSNYAGPIDDLDPDSNVLKLNKDLTGIEEVLSQSLQPSKFKYIFESLGLLVASILMNSIQYLKKINENGIKKMCRNLFAIQQNLTNITMSREPDLDHARQYYELLYLNPDDILTAAAEKGLHFTFQEYSQIIQLYHRSHPGAGKSLLEKRMQTLREIFEKGQTD